MIHFIAQVTRKIEDLLDICLYIVLAVILLYGLYSIYDIMNIYDKASGNDLLSFKPPIVSEGGDVEGDEMSFQKLLEINPEIVAWITIDRTNIDYPIARAGDNIKYVNYDAYGEFSLSGCPFLDCRNRADFTDGYNMVYGHHMSMGLMFGQLDSFLQQSFLEKHTTGSLYLADGSQYSIEWYASVITDAYDEIIYTRMPLEDELYGEDTSTNAEFNQYIEDHAVCWREAEIVDGSDAIIALSTCSDASTNARILLFGVIKGIYQR